MPEGLTICSMVIAEAADAKPQNASSANAIDVTNRVMSASPPAGWYP